MMEPAEPVSAPCSEEELVGEIRRGGRALVALSGGVDSSFVASLAHDALGEDATAVTLTGVAVGAAEVERARRVARTIGIDHQLVTADPLARVEYRANPSNRCYFCRTVEADVLRSVGATRGVLQYLDGVQLDDLEDDRPGLRAMAEAGFTHPLVVGRWRKKDVRVYARRRGLPNWDEPSNACLASRVPHGEPITEELLRRVERAESVLIAEGFRRVRVRVAHGAARIEVDPEEVARLRAEPLASWAVTRLRSLGFDDVTIDPRGYGGGKGAAPASR